MSEGEMPRRIQLSRKKGWRLPSNTVVVSRPGPFGNPWSVRWCAKQLDLTENAARYQVVEWFTDWIKRSNDNEALDELGHYSGTRKAHARIHQRLPELRGKNLACWCPLDAPCHADVLIEMANALRSEAPE